MGSDQADGFTYSVRANGEILILHNGVKATILRGRAAERFLQDIDDGDSQEGMARVTGNYRRGNERLARNHPRNRSQP